MRYCKCILTVDLSDTQSTYDVTFVKGAYYKFECDEEEENFQLIDVNGNPHFPVVKTVFNACFTEKPKGEYEEYKKQQNINKFDL